MKTPLISVVVPMYNVECYIKVCIDSILAQTFQDFEIIIVDDASTDNSYNICKKFYGGNEKVRIVRHEENQGLGPARNTGIEYARGKYIFFVDSDDFILPNALEILYDVAETSGAEIVHASQYYETTQDDDKPLDFDKITLAKDPHQTEGFITTDILYRWENCWQHWEDADGIRSMSWLNFYRSDIFENYPLYFEPIISEDELFAFEIFAYVNKFFVINQPFYIYRQRENSLMNSNNPNRLSQGILALFVSVDKLKAVINRFSKLRGNTEIQEHFTAKLLDAHLFNHIKPFYENGLTQETEFVIDGILQEIFGENKTFVKYFFNLANDLRSKIEKLWAQINQLNGAYHHLLYRHRQTELFLSEQADILKLFDAMKTDAKKIFLLGTPNHGNLGDHAIAAAEYFVLENLFPNHKIIEIPFRYLTGVFGEIFYGLGFEKYVQPDDLIAMLGGGNLGNLWVEEESFRRSVIEKFHGNKIIIFPQSVHFTNDEDGQEQLSISEKIYNAHPDLHLMLRDENSFNLANKIFPNINTYLLPDVVTALYGILDNVNVEREGVLFILRSDKEKVRDDSIVENLQEFLTQNNISFNVIDTVINETVYKKNREKKIYDVLMKIRQSRLVITDRFHGVIFSYITRTPVMAFKSFDTKISSGIKWFKDLSSIFYAENATFDDMKNFITQFYNQTLPAQINTNFVANFAEILQAIVPKQEYKTNNLVSRLKFVECLVPISHCNLHCDYCYVIQGNYRDSSMPSFRRTPEEIGLAFKPERWNAQSLFVSFCGAGETLLCKELSDIVRYVLEQGNFVNITTNGTIEKEIEKLINLPSELTRRLVFAFSLHYNELKRKNLLETFAKNVQKVANSDASFLVQLNLYDGYIDYLDEIKEYCIQNFGALPQLVLTRDQTKGMKIHSSHSMEIYRKYGEDFKSSLFEFTCDNFLKKHEDFCFAGEKSYTLQLATGDLRRCYFDSLFFNIYDDLESKVPESPVGYNCKDSYCVNASHFLALGVMPEFKCPSYASLRNRKEGGWYKETIWNALNEKFDCRISDKNLKRGGGV